MASGAAFDTPFRSMSADLIANSDSATLTNIGGTFAGGDVTGRVSLGYGKTAPVDGEVAFSGIEVSQVDQNVEEPIAVDGLLSGRVVLSGTQEALRIAGPIEASNLIFEKEQVGALKGELNVVGERYELRRVSLLGPNGKAHSDKIWFDATDESIGGSVSVSEFDLTDVAALKDLSLIHI